jgi:DNA-binding NarL/FixJ family response regulator
VLYSLRSFDPQTEAEPAVTTVWLVEDNAAYRRDLAELLGHSEGLECPLAVASCEKAIAALEAGQVPDIVLMDIGLPGMDGIEGARRLRALAPSARVIILTVHEEDEKIFAAICAGASGYLLKPLPSERIVAAIREVSRGAAPISGYIARRVLEMFARNQPPAPRQDAYGLTGREKEILQLLVDDLTVKAVAARLNLSVHTIDTHVRNIYDKLHVRSRSGAVVKALRERLV